MVARIVYGSKIAESIKHEVQELRKSIKTKPFISVVATRENPASIAYRKAQKSLCEEMNFGYKENLISQEISEEELLAIVRKFNCEKKITGISIHLPLPKHINEQKILESILPEKDIECVHPSNLGNILQSADGLVPCAAGASLEIILSCVSSLSGKEITIIGHSAMVGKSLALLLLCSKTKSPTVTICHIATKDITIHTKISDIVISAAGKPNLVRGSCLKKGAIVVDVGINKVGNKIVGDVNFEEAKEVASYLTPVPGGVGRVALAILARNIVKCASRVGNFRG